MYFITTKRMLEVCFFQHTPTFIIEPVKKGRKGFYLLCALMFSDFVRQT